jgi:hypothetical protein
VTAQSRAGISTPAANSATASPMPQASGRCGAASASAAKPANQIRKRARREIRIR